MADNRSTVYCVVKSAIMRKKDGTVVCSIPFGCPVRMLSITDDGKIYGEFYRQEKKVCVKYRGFAPKVGFVGARVIDMAGLYHINKTGKRIPVSMRINGSVNGWINAGSRVSVLAMTDGWMLTEKGWTKSAWLEKDREVIDIECLRTLAYAVISQTVKDYVTIIHKIQKKGRFVPNEFAKAVGELQLIRQWFHDGDYLKIFEDNMSGEERLEMLDKELGVTDEWIRRILSKVKI